MSTPTYKWRIHHRGPHLIRNDHTGDRYVGWYSWQPDEGKCVCLLFIVESEGLREFDSEEECKAWMIATHRLLTS